MLRIYNLFIALYYVAVRLFSLRNKKAKAWINGRKNGLEDLKTRLQGNEKIIWMHCASAGEFEQGKPVIEALKKQYADHFILVSFFSPSGYEAAVNYSFADSITYLPLDTKNGAANFVSLVNPVLVVFVKYEFWFHHLSAVATRNIPLLLISAVFRKNQVFFKWYGGFFRKILSLFNFLFVQDQTSLHFLKGAGFTNCAIGGDTRFDRVKAIAEVSGPLLYIKEFCQGCEVVVAGSTWPGDEKLLAEFLDKHPHIKLILVPHQINNGHLQQIQSLFPTAAFYTNINMQLPSQNRVLVIDKLGMLARLYAYATLAYVGGGLTKDGIHNILEAAVWGKPVVFGPNYKKYREAFELIEGGGGFSITNASEFTLLINSRLQSESQRNTAGLRSIKYIDDNTGGTKIIMDFIQEKRLLTSS